MSNENLVSLVSFILLLATWIVLILHEWQKKFGSTHCILRIICSISFKHYEALGE